MTSKFSKMLKGAALVSVMAFGLMLSTSTTAGAQISVYTYNNNGQQQRTRVAYERGYRDGVRAGERAARGNTSYGYYNNGYNNSYSSGYRNPYANDNGYNNGYGGAATTVSADGIWHWYTALFTVEAGASVDDQGTVTVGPSGLKTGSLTNGGVLTLGNGIALTVNGDYTQTATGI